MDKQENFEKLLNQKLLERLLKRLKEKHQEYLDKHMAAVQDGGAYSEPYFNGYCDALDDVIKTINSITKENEEEILR